MGTAVHQPRFRYNEWEQLRHVALMTQRIDMSRVKLDVLMPWISEHFGVLFNIEEFLNEELKKEQHVCPRVFSHKLIGFLSAHKIQQFMTDLWEVLLISQQSGIGMPPFIMQQLQEDEILKREKEKKRKRTNSSKCRHSSCRRCYQRDNRVVDDINPYQSVNKQGASSTSKYALRRCDDTSDDTSDGTSGDSDESSQCACCGRPSCSPQSSTLTNRSSSPRRRRATRKDDGKQAYRREEQVVEVVEKFKNSNTKDTTTLGSQKSVKRSKTSTEKEITITPLSSLATKGATVSKTEQKKTKTDIKSGEVPLVNCTQPTLNNNSKKPNNEKPKKRRKRSKKCSSKSKPDDHCPRNSEAGSSKDKKPKNNGSRLMYELRKFESL